jgi:hypothetical protein
MQHLNRFCHYICVEPDIPLIWDRMSLDIAKWLFQDFVIIDAVFTDFLVVVRRIKDIRGNVTALGTNVTAFSEHIFVIVNTQIITDFMSFKINEYIIILGSFTEMTVFVSPNVSSIGVIAALITEESIFSTDHIVTIMVSPIGVFGLPTSQTIYKVYFSHINHTYI